MNHIVPDFESNGDYPIRELHKKLVMEGNEDIMELLWHNGQVVMQSQNLRSGGNKRSSSREVRSSVNRETGPLDLFMHEEEMASWLHYPSDENSLESYIYNNDLLYLTPPSCAPVTTASATLPPPPSVMIPSGRPLVPSIRCVEVESGPTKYTNSMNFLRPIMSVSSELGQSSSSKMAPAKILPSPSTVMASNERPTTEAPESRASLKSDIPPRISTSNIGVGVDAEGKPSMGREIETCEMSVTSSLGSGGSGASGSVEPATQKPPLSTDDRKRKGRDIDNMECHSEDVEFEDHDAKKQSYGGSTSTKRSRAAEVHNLSERKRRDRINEKMKALQDLIPRCNKSDKASMLDEAIEYLKSLQIQVQMMSMGCSMVPMMFPGVQQYVPPMAMGVGMGMGMGMVMDMGMNRTMVPYPPILPNPSLPNPAASAAAAAATATAQIGQRFPVPGLNMPSVVVGSVARQTANISAPMMSSFPHHNQIQPRVPNFVDPFQHYVGLHQTQLPLPEYQGGMPPIATKPSSTKDAINPDHNQTRNPSPLYF